MSSFEFDPSHVQRPFEHLPDMTDMAPELHILDTILGVMNRLRLPDFSYNGYLDSLMSIELLKQPSPQKLDDKTAIATFSLICTYLAQRIEHKQATVRITSHPIEPLYVSRFSDMSMLGDGPYGVAATVLTSMENYADMDGRYRPNFEYWSKISSVVMEQFEQELPPDA